MKEKGIIFIVGLLVGAIISTGSILVYTSLTNNNSNNSNNSNMTIPSGGMGDMQNGNGEMTMPNVDNTNMPQMPTNE